MKTAEPGSEVRALRLHDGPTENWGVFCPDSGPAFVGDGSLDWVCPNCGATLVRGALHEDQFLDLLFRCSECGAVGESQLRAPGRPLPGTPLLTPPGAYRLGSPVDIAGKLVLCVGQQALDGYVAETGVGRPRGAHGRLELSANSLRQLATECIDLLGDRYGPLKAADARGLASATPPRHRHRLVELIEYAQHAADLLEHRRDNEHLELDANLLGELLATTGLMRRWRNHPAWPRLASTLAGETEGQHTVMLLAVASLLADAGNGVGLVVVEEGEKRVPDLWVEPTLLERLEVEVKTPLELRGPLSAPLTPDSAVRLIERQVKAAASTKKGQLSAEDSGILAIGGYHLGPGALDTLENAAEIVLGRQADRKRHLAAVVVTQMSYEIVSTVGEDGRETSSLSPTLENRLIRHPGYGGDLTMDEGQPPGRLTP